MRDDISVAELLVKQENRPPFMRALVGGLGGIFVGGAVLMGCAYLLIQASYATIGFLGGPSSEAEMIAAVKHGAELRLKSSVDSAQ